MGNYAKLMFTLTPKAAAVFALPMYQAGVKSVGDFFLAALNDELTAKQYPALNFAECRSIQNDGIDETGRISDNSSYGLVFEGEACKVLYVYLVRHKIFDENGAINDFGWLYGLADKFASSLTARDNLLTRAPSIGKLTQ